MVVSPGLGEVSRRWDLGGTGQSACSLGLPVWIGLVLNWTVTRRPVGTGTKASIAWWHRGYIHKTVGDWHDLQEATEGVALCGRYFVYLRDAAANPGTDTADY